MFKIRLIMVLATVFFVTSYAENSNFLEADAKSVVLSIKGINALTQDTLTGSINWKLVNKNTDRVISISGDNSATVINIGIEKNYINKGEWLISGVSDHYIGTALLEIEGNKNQLVEVNMLPKDMKIKIDSPVEAVASTVIQINWSIPDTIKGKINLQKIGDEPNFYAPPHIFTRGNKEQKKIVRLPSEAGEYVFRFYNAEDTKKIIAEKTIKLIEAKIKLVAPKEGIAGTEINVSWTAPKTALGKINLKYAKDKPRYNARSFIHTQGKQKGTLVLPSDAGEYVLRWYSVFDRRAMLEHFIKVTENKITINAPDTAEPKAVIRMKWKAANQSRARIVLSKNEEDHVKKDLGSVLVRDNTEASIALPDESGDYTLSWINEGDGKTMTKHDIVVGWASRELLAPDRKSFDVD